MTGRPAERPFRFRLLLLCLSLLALPPLAPPLGAQRQVAAAVIRLGPLELPAGEESLPAELAAYWRDHFERARPAVPGLSWDTQGGGEEPHFGLRVQRRPPGFRVDLTLEAPGAKPRESRLEIQGERPEALVAAVAGEILFLWALHGPGPALLAPPEALAGEPEPVLCGLLGLPALSLLAGEGPAAGRGAGGEAGPPGGGVGTPAAGGALSEPLECVAFEGAPALLLAGGLLRLGPHLELSLRSAQDLALPAALPGGFRPTYLGFDPLGEPLLYDAEAGTLLVFHPGEPRPELCGCGVLRPTGFCTLPGGGIALLAAGRAELFFRQGGSLRRQLLPLPAGLVTALEADTEGRLWALDVAERRLRVLSPSGEELLSVKPLLDPSRLPFPQVFRLLPDGGFLLGGSGELWRFDANGFPLWRLGELYTGLREGLPAFFQLAVCTADGSLVIYLLDPVGRRLLKLREAASAEQILDPVDRALAAALPQPQSLLPALLGRELYLPALALLQQPLGAQASGSAQGGGVEGGTRAAAVARLLEQKQARLTGEQAGRLEAELRLPEAEALYNRALALYRGLRQRDPIDPSFPEAIRLLEEGRNRVRRILVEEGLLEASLRTPWASAGAGTESTGPASLELTLTLRNAGRTVLRELQIDARFGGLPRTRWTGDLDALSPGAEVPLRLFLSPRTGGPTVQEDLLLPLALLVRFSREGERAALYFRFPVLFPAGSLLRQELSQGRH
jgi:hypothetical protein